VQSKNAYGGETQDEFSYAPPTPAAEPEEVW